MIGTSAPSECVELRKQALELMLAHPRREGLFDGRLAGRIGMMAWGLEQGAARKAMGLDVQTEAVGEGNLQGDLMVPEHARIVFMDIEYGTDDEHRARVRLANAGEMQRGGGTVVKIEY